MSDEIRREFEKWRAEHPHLVLYPDVAWREGWQAALASAAEREKELESQLAKEESANENVEVIIMEVERERDELRRALEEIIPTSNDRRIANKALKVLRASDSREKSAK